MTPEARREQIMEILKCSDKAVKGSVLSDKFDVSRQVIVQDIALLRAEGFEVLATSKGYVIPKFDRGKILKTIVTKHFSVEEVQEELMIMINNGAAIIDVVVSHPLYGDMRGVLDLHYKIEVDKFLEEVKEGRAEFLSSLTDGIHIHTIEVPSEESYEKIKDELRERGFLVQEREELWRN